MGIPHRLLLWEKVSGEAKFGRILTRYGAVFEQLWGDLLLVWNRCQVSTLFPTPVSDLFPTFSGLIKLRNPRPLDVLRDNWLCLLSAQWYLQMLSCPNNLNKGETNEQI